MRARARLIAAYVEHIGLPVRRMLDAGCGIGLLRAPLERSCRAPTYVGLEASEYLCAALWLGAGTSAELPHCEVPSIWSSAMTCCNISTMSGRARALANLARLVPRRAVFHCAHGGGLALELRSAADGFKRTSAQRRVVSRASATRFSRDRRRLLAATRRPASSLGARGRARHVTARRDSLPLNFAAGVACRRDSQGRWG